MTFSRRTMLSGLGAAAISATPAVAGANTSQIKDLQGAIDKAVEGDGVLHLGAGSYETPGLRIDKPVRVEGVPGLTRITGLAGGPIVVIESAAGVSLRGLTFSGDTSPVPDDNAGAALVMAGNASDLLIEACSFTTSSLTALRLENCAGRIVGNTFRDIEVTGIFALDSAGLEIASNSLDGIGNNGIQVWTREPKEDGTLVSNNRIAHVAARAGGTGQNGNGINIYKAGNVLVSGNRVSDCAFSGVRNNSGSNCQIVNNSISRTGEVAVYCEFGFEGAVVSGNMIDDVALGISITNFNEGGRLAVVSGNVIRKVKGGGTLPDTHGVGIGAEAETVVTGNVIEDAADTGISLGWGKYARNLSATGNLIRNCRRGIVFSVTEGADAVQIANNRIAGARDGAIIGGDHGDAATGDLGAPGAEIPAGALISGNLIR